jgi:hypothetical protein
MNKLTATIVAGLFLCLAGAARADKAPRSNTSRSNMLGATEHQIYFGTDVDFALPLGTYSDANGVGGGVLLTAEYPLVGIIDQLSVTARAGFQFHTDKDLGAGVNNHIHSIPVLFGAKYYLMEQNRQGLFAAAEMGLFDLMQSSSVGVSASEMKFGAGLGVGYAYEKWNARVNVHTHDVGNLGDSVMITAGIGYQFAGL